MLPTPPCFPLLGFCLRVFSAAHKDLSCLHGAQSVLGSTYVSHVCISVYYRSLFLLPTLALNESVCSTDEFVTHGRVPSNNKQKEGVERWIDEGVWTKKCK